VFWILEISNPLGVQSVCHSIFSKCCTSAALESVQVIADVILDHVGDVLRGSRWEAEGLQHLVCHLVAMARGSREHGTLDEAVLCESSN
jgi:hypothetical protein